MVKPHTVETTWRGARLAQTLATAAAIEELLEHVDDVEQALADDEPVVSQSRSFAALLRSRRDDLVSEARRLEVAT